MPNTLSAKKNLRQNISRRGRNRAVKTFMRSQVIELRKLIASGDLEASEAQFKVAVKKLDQAAAKSIIHPNKAARTKSRLSKAIKSLKAK